MAPRLKISDDEYDLLTEEERIGLKEYQAEYEAEMAAEDEEIEAAGKADDPPEKPAKADPPEKPKKAAAPEPSEEPDEPDEPDEEADDEDPEADDEPDEEADDEDPDAGEDGDAEAEEDDEPPAAAAPALPSLTKAEEERILAIDKLLDEVADRFDEGEITAKEMREQQKTLLTELDELKDKRTIAKVTSQNAVNSWYTSTIPIFMAQHAEYKDGSMRHRLLDSIVRELQMKSNNPTDPKILVEAHKRIVAELGEVNGAAKPTATNGKAKKAKKQREQTPNFGAIPASDPTAVTTPNKFARLDKLTGVDYEKALAKLSPADRDFYLQGG
jgi:hypothetical protein